VKQETVREQELEHLNKNRDPK